MSVILVGVVMTVLPRLVPTRVTIVVSAVPGWDVCVMRVGQAPTVALSSALVLAVGMVIATMAHVVVTLVGRAWTALLSPVPTHAPCTAFVIRVTGRVSALVSGWVMTVPSPSMTRIAHVRLNVLISVSRIVNGNSQSRVFRVVGPVISTVPDCVSFHVPDVQTLSWTRWHLRTWRRVTAAREDGVERQLLKSIQTMRC